VLVAEVALKEMQKVKAEEKRVQKKLTAAAVKERHMLASGKIQMVEPVPENWDGDAE
jgi:hypothetical protein